ncbi:homoserine kinase [Ammonifex degensii KC4]|uniref:Homoserine kinase n=1 Tax=Ammonifex degensii (strain DSM 10501 / KC4) TaxID=429009 RepID=C9RCP4_AMMDK|nr:homoserine kinase [Ammonifex degensii]ACX52021.1 homoserine kinase [Ammonifex degensii KC4]
MKLVTVTVPASTANLGSGCDCFALALSLYLRVTLAPRQEEGIFWEIKGEGATVLWQERERSLILKAFRRVEERLKGVFAFRGLKITVDNQIPLGAGLGSSGAAIVAGSLAANLLAGSVLTKEEILNLAAEIEGHPDNVAASLLGGAVAVAQTEKGVVVSQVEIDPELRIVVALPHFSLSTSASRRLLPSHYRREEVLFNLARAALLSSAFACRRYELLRWAMEDRLYYPYREKLIPGAGKVIEAALAAGAWGAALSGAGPSLVALTSKARADTVGEAMREAFAQARVEARLLILVPDNEGAKCTVTF